MAKRSRLDELAPALRPLLSAFRDGILAWYSQPQLAMNVLDQYTQMGDPEILRKSYEFFTRVAPFEPSLQPTIPGIKAILDFLARDDGARRRAVHSGAIRGYPVPGTAAKLS